MSIFDKVKDKASELARNNGERIGQTVDKTAEAINRRTQGKHADKVHDFAAKAKDAADNLGKQPPR
ncbi:MAG: antitoxin [Actinobacteria bacterium]|nr:antitoxin [Actinomycetota bacterium]